jgi:hypothetical protein
MLSGVACPSATDCSAVGSYTDGAENDFALVERWNGKRWAAQSIPDLIGALSSIACSSATACTAVGGQAERWNGKRWRLQRTANPPGGGLSGVACVSPSGCIAVGSSFFTGTEFDATLVERWTAATPQPPFTG